MLDIPYSDEPLEGKLWNKHLDAFLQTGKLNPDIIEYMNPVQQWTINEIKKSFKRIERKNQSTEVPS